jgi:hypothetical protein
MGEQVVVPPLIDQKRGEPKKTSRLAALVKRIAELRTTDLRSCHCTEEFTLQRICPLGRQDILAYDCPWLADPSREPATGKMFNLHF